jgi:hypothetical protein
MKSPSVHKVIDLMMFAKDNVTCIRGHWVPARPLGLASIINRIKCAWLVFTGKADAVIWPEDDDYDPYDVPGKRVADEIDRLVLKRMSKGK